MASGIAISTVPYLVSSGLFSSRRFNSGMDAVASNNIPVGIMNCDIAGGQITNLFQGAVDIAKESKNAFAAKLVSAEEMLKAASKNYKTINGIRGTLEFTGRYINPIIGATGILKTALAEDKVEEGCTQACGIGIMLGGENAIKRALCIPISKRVNGKRVIEERYKWYKKYPMIDKQVNALNDYCATKKVLGKSLKFVPGVAKGIALVCTSIVSYIIGSKIGKAVSKWVKKFLGDVPKYNNTINTGNTIEISTNNTTSNCYTQAA